MTDLVLRGRCWVLGDQVDTDALAPGPYMRRPLAELARHCLESVTPRFAAEVQAGDLLVAGHGFGIGSSREQAVQVLQHLGVAAVVARGFGRIFYRNALNLGLPVLQCAGPVATEGEVLELHPRTGRIINLSRGVEQACEPIPGRLLEIVAAGGLLPWLQARLAAAASSQLPPGRAG